MPNNYIGKINRNTDWGGDESTGFLPVAGESVQSHIKEELNSKIGAVYKPEGIDAVYYFSTEEDKQAYLDTHDESYVLYSYELGSNYDVELDRDTLVLSNSVLKGTTGNSISFRFKIVDKNGMSSDATAKIELSFTGSGVSNRFTNEIPVVAGDWTLFSTNIDDYLRDGSNSIAIKITGMSTKATTQFIMTYNIFNLKFIVDFDYNKVQEESTISIPYLIECTDTKYLEFFVDGEPVESVERMTIEDPRKESTATIDISSLSEGQHSLQVRAYVRSSSDGALFYTPSYYYTFAKKGGEQTTFLMSIITEDGTNIVEGDDKYKISVSQFEQIKFDWSIYSNPEMTLNINFEYDGNIVSTALANGNEKISTFNYRPMDFGEGKVLRVYAVGENDELLFEHEINIDVAETTSGIKETTDKLLLKLQSIGRRNTDENRDKWEYRAYNGNTYFARFNDFTWNSQQGWDEETESLVISNAATVSFGYRTNSGTEGDFCPMSNDWCDNGGAVEIDLETFDIEDEDAVICECRNNLQESEAYFKITATNAEFATQNGAKINTRYKDNDRLKIVFIGNKFGDQEDDRMIYIVVNGVLERAAMYTRGDHMSSEAPLVIGDPTGKCKVRLRSIRVYNKAIKVDEAFNNFVVDSDDVQGMYEKNNVLAQGSETEIGFDKVANKLPVMIFTGDMNELVTEGQSTKVTSGKWYYFDVEYINRQEPDRNFVAFNARMKLQGTSSLGYPRKNFKLNTKDKNFTDDIYYNSNYELDPTSVPGNLQLRNKITGERIDFDDFKDGGTIGNKYCFMLDYKGEPLEKGKYRFRANAHKAQKWTLKADFMESSCSHNVAAGRSWNDIFENTPLLTNGESSYVDQTYKDSALVSGSSRDYIEYYGPDIEGEIRHYKIPYNSQEIKDQKKYVCRTDAQKICKAAGQDDVRTAVDGFPMVCFYRTSHAANDLVFIGQYNFINDKSSAEVFGFEDIETPHDKETMIYDAHNVEVFEGLKNSNPISLFQTLDGFYDLNPVSKIRGWAETYESRYPDQEDAETEPALGAALSRGVDALHDLSEWILSTRHEDDTQYGETLNVDAYFAKRINTYQYGYTSATTAEYEYFEGTNLEDNAENRQKKFETEKWEHFDVWKVAGYYVYLMRYGAVDQFVKNTMLFTDGNGKYDPRTDLKYRKWFFINYDNDCLFGLRNNGQLAFHWDLDRQTTDNASDIEIDDQVDETGTNAYAMMGHDSTLWNNLERDDEFMRMVRDLDYSMSKYKLNYDNMVKEFDTDQTERWCERIYNANERYKYIHAAKGIGDMEGHPVNNLWMLQGTRRSHRHWWIANHFNLLDAKWLSGDYKNTYVMMKTGCLSGTTIHAKAGAKFYYAWGQQKKIYESNMQRNEGDAIDFTFSTNQVLGDPVQIYSFNKMTEMDFSETASLTYEGSFEFHLGKDLVQNLMKKLVIGNPDVVNKVDIDTTTWVNIPNLEYLDVTNYEGITDIPLNSFKNLHTLKAMGSKLGNFEPANGSSFDLVELPQTVGTMILNDISFKNKINNDLVYTPSTNLTTLEISNNHGVKEEYYNKLIIPWIRAIESSTQWMSLYRTKEITVHNIDWNLPSLDDIMVFKNFKKYGKKFDFSGVIDIRRCGNLSMENIESIMEIFDNNCFNPRTAKLYVISPDSIFIDSDKNEMVAGQTNIFRRKLYPDEEAVSDKNPDINYYIVTETNRTKSEAEEGEIIFEDKIGHKNYLVVNNISGVRPGLSLENTVDADGKQIGILRCVEYKLERDDTFKVLVNMDISDSLYDKVSVMDFTVKDPTYATSSTIEGVKSLYKDKEYRYTLKPLTNRGVAPIGSYDVYWNISGDALPKYISRYEVDPNDKLSFKVWTNSSQPDDSEISSQLTISATITNNDDGHTSVSTSYGVLILNENVIMTRDSNPVAMNVFHNATIDGQPMASNADAMTKSEAERITDISRIFRNKNSEPFSLLELRYFTGLTSLSTSAFQNSSITEIALPGTITSIGGYCFNDCTSLRGVYVAEEGIDNITYTPTLPNRVTEVKEGTFRNCRQMNDFTLPNSVTSIGNFAFGGTGFVEARLHDSEGGAGILRLSNNLQSIAAGAFEVAKWTPETTTNKLTRIEIPATTHLSSTFEELLGRNYVEFVVEQGNTSLLAEDGVLYDGSQGTLLRYPPKKAHVEDFVTSVTRIVNHYAFFAVEGVDYITFNGNVADIGNGAFRECTAKIINIEETTIADIKFDTFRDCTNLETIMLPNAGGLKKIGMRAFYNCNNLKNINLPEGITELECDTLSNTYTFYRCNLLSGIVFPTTIEKMGINTVCECPNIKNIVFPSKYDFTTMWNINGANVITEDTENDELVIRNKNVPYNIVFGCPQLESVTLPAMSYTKTDDEGNTSSIEVNELSLDDKWVKKMSIPTAISQTNGLYIIEGGSRGNIKEYKLPEIDNGEKYVSINGIIYTSDKKKVVLAPINITSAVLDDAVETIGEFAFTGSRVETLTFGPNITTCEKYAFQGCSNLTSSDIVSNLRSIGNRCFDGAGFTSVEIGKNLLAIPQYAFNGCPNLATVTFNGFSGGIGRFGFADCPMLKTIIVSCEVAPSLENIWYGTYENMGWYQFKNAGSSVSNKELLVSVGTSRSFTRTPGETATPDEYVVDQETSWNFLMTDYGFTIKEEIPVSGICDVNIFVGGTPYTASIVYADSVLGNLIFPGNEVYSSTYDGDSYMFGLDGLYDGETIRIYSDADKTSPIGTFKPRIGVHQYQVGDEVSLGAGMRKSAILGASVDGDEMAEITKDEYNALLSRVNQLTKIIKNLVK